MIPFDKKRFDIGGSIAYATIDALFEIGVRAWDLDMVPLNGPKRPEGHRQEGQRYMTRLLHSLPQHNRHNAYTEVGNLDRLCELICSSSTYPLVNGPFEYQRYSLRKVPQRIVIPGSVYDGNDITIQQRREAFLGLFFPKDSLDIIVGQTGTICFGDDPKSRTNQFIEALQKSVNRYCNLSSVTVHYSTQKVFRN